MEHIKPLTRGHTSSSQNTYKKLIKIFKNKFLKIMAKPYFLQICDVGLCENRNIAVKQLEHVKSFVIKFYLVHCLPYLLV